MQIDSNFVIGGQEHFLPTYGKLALILTVGCDASLLQVIELPFLYSCFAICAVSKLIRAAFRPLLPLATKGIFEPAIALVYLPDKYEPYMLPACPQNSGST